LKSLTAFILFLFVFIGATGVSAATEPEPIPSDPAIAEHQYQRAHGAVRDSYWDRVAWCETHRDWKNGGNWAGGLGIARSTWNGFGGKDFAPTPDRATRLQQIVIANRISVFGYQTHHVYATQRDRELDRSFFRNPVGFHGWGCTKVTGIPRNKPHIR